MRRAIGSRAALEGWDLAVFKRGAIEICTWGGPAALTVLFFGRVMRRMLDAGDFPAHVRIAQRMADTGEIRVPHFGFHAVVIAVHEIFPPAGWTTAALIVTVAIYVLCAMIVVAWVRRVLPPQMMWTRLFATALLPFTLLTVNPVLPFGLLKREPFLMGYFPANIHHNPTTTASRPLALLIFACAQRALRGRQVLDARVRRAIGVAALVLVSGLVKPSYLMALIPALALLAAWRWRQTDWRLLTAGIFLPAGILLLFQYFMKYHVATDGVSITWAPLEVIRYFSPTDFTTLARRMGSSALFPLAVTALFPNAAVYDVGLVLAWTTFACGATYGYLLAEAGGKTSSGDFLWSGQISAFVLFVVSAVFLLGRTVDIRRSGSRLPSWIRPGVCALLLLWHVVSGLRHLKVSWFD